MKESNIYVTKPFLPPLKEFLPYLEKIWDSRVLTNSGPFHQQLEEELTKFLGVKYLSLFSNGTLALITSLQALDITGEVITTPFSFIATTHSLWWNKIKPIFVDIENNYLNIDPDKIESAITSETKAILPVHVYGSPCKVDEIQVIASKYNLKVIYDSAHAFNVKRNGDSILNFGDLSVLSFHATKVFSTIEGGAIISHSAEMKHHIDNLRNFGFRGETQVEEPGINAKLNEISSAFGLLQLKYVNQVIEKRKRLCAYYRQLLTAIPGIKLIDEMKGIDYSYTYFPILVNKEEFGIDRDEVYEKLKHYGIFSRRYFYPLISSFHPYNKIPSANPANLPIANKISEQVLCLPVYYDLDLRKIDFIVKILKKK